MRHLTCGNQGSNLALSSGNDTLTMPTLKNTVSVLTKHGSGGQETLSLATLLIQGSLNPNFFDRHVAGQKNHPRLSGTVKMPVSALKMRRSSSCKHWQSWNKTPHEISQRAHAQQELVKAALEVEMATLSKEVERHVLEAWRGRTFHKRAMFGEGEERGWRRAGEEGRRGGYHRSKSGDEQIGFEECVDRMEEDHSVTTMRPKINSELIPAGRKFEFESCQ